MRCGVESLPGYRIPGGEKEMAMKKAFLALFLIGISGMLSAQGWVQRADIQGDITDVLVIGWNGSSGDIYVATNGSGVYYSTDGVCWSERNNGLGDLQVVALAWANDCCPNYVKAATLSGLVYYSPDYGQNWYLDGFGLDSIDLSYTPTDLTMIYDGYLGTWLTYMSTIGAGVLRQEFINDLWQPYNIMGGAGGLINLDILSIASAQDTSTGKHKVVAGARGRVGDSQHPSTVYVMPDPQDNGWWQATGTPDDVSFPSVAFHESGFAIVGTTTNASGIGQGVYYSIDLDSSPTFQRICNFPPNQPFTAVDYYYDSSASRYRISAGTPRGIWWVDDPWHCNIVGYSRFSQFRGSIAALGIGNSGSAWAGGPGKGPVRFNPTSVSGAVTNVRGNSSGCYLKDYNIVDIAPSPNFGSSDTTVFTASGIGGVYKNMDPINCNNNQNGYFYRMIGDPDSWGTVPILKVKPQINYNEQGCYAQQVVYATTLGKGLMRSDDGGRSWRYRNGLNGELDNAVITDIVLHPTNEAYIYVSAYGKGVYGSPNRGDTWTLLGSIPNPRVLSLAVPDNCNYANPTLYAGFRPVTSVLGQEYGLYKYENGEWLVYPDTYGMNVAEIELSPQFSTYPRVIIGLEERPGAPDGIRYSINGGDTWTDITGSLPSPTHVDDLKMSPGYVNDQMVLTTIRSSAGGSGIFWASEYYGWSWNRINRGDLPDNQVLSTAFAPGFLFRGEIFAGHATQGLFSAYLDIDYTDPTCPFQAASGFFNVPPHIRGLAVSPDDSNLVFAATSNEGVFISRDGGDTFQPWSKGPYLAAGNLCPVESVTSVAVTETVSGATYLEEDFSSGIPGTWTIINGGIGAVGGPGLTWMVDGTVCDRQEDEYYPDLFTDPYVIADSDCEGGGATQDEWLITPYLNTSSAQKLVVSFSHLFYTYSGNEHGYVKVCSSATGGNCGDDVGDWVTVMDYNGDDFIGRTTIDLTPYRGTGFRVAFHYTDATYDWFWAVDNVTIGELAPRVVVGTEDNGIYFADYDDSAYFGTFNPSNINIGSVTELRYSSYDEDMRASHIQYGDLHSADFGETWDVVPGIPGGYGMTDVAYGDGFKRALNGFTWGCSSGKQVASVRAVGDCINTAAAWYYQPSLGFWQECGATIPDTCEDFRAILELNSGAVLLGSIGVGNGAPDSYSEGVYRLDTACWASGAEWVPSNEGLPIYPGGENAGKITAFYQDPINQFVLAAVNDSYTTDGNDGGVYYSDSSSDGRAWVKTDLPAVEPGSFELTSTSGGTTVYTGLTSDGIWSSLPSSIGVLSPAGFFECATEACEVCLGSSTTFWNYSAGNVTGYSWSFGDGFGYSSQASPTYIYPYSGSYTVSLTVSNSYGSDPTPYTRGFEVKEELDFNGTSDRLTVSRIDSSTVTLSWDDLNAGETGYQVWASNSASSGSTYGSPVGPDTTSATASGYTYFRIQPLGSGYACGNGPVGGSW